MNKIIDLHIHTNKSDGAYSPKEVIDMAKENGVSVMSISDHDTVDAYSEELFDYAKEKGITLISAVEISTKINKCGIHVLGYNIDLNNEVLKNKLYELRNTRHIYLYDVSDKLEELGYIVNKEELDKIDSVTKAHIALDVVNNKDNEKILMDNFNHIPGKGEFIEKIMNEGCPAYVRKNTITPKEAVELIREAHGKAVLAHPVAYHYEDSLSYKEIDKLVTEMEIDAIEACYIYVDMDNVIHNDVDYWLKFAKQRNLHYTVGSDFHNKDGVRPVIGLINSLILTDEQVNEILNYIKK